MLIEQIKCNYSKLRSPIEYEELLTVFLDDVSYELIKLFSLINNILLGALILSCVYQLQHK